MIRPKSIGEAHRIIVQLEGRIAELEQPWISVEDRLPEEKCQVLCLGEDGFCVRIYYQHDWYDEHTKSTMNVLGEREDITHWQPLPDPPNSEEG